MWRQHSSKSQYQRGSVWFWTDGRCSVSLYHPCCYYEWHFYKWYLDGFLLIHFWTSAHCGHWDTEHCFLCSWWEMNTGGWPCFPVGPMMTLEFVSHKQMSGDYNLCDVLKVEFVQKWLSSVICKMGKICNYWQKKNPPIHTNHNVAYFTIYSQEESSNEML